MCTQISLETRTYTVNRDGFSFCLYADNVVALGPAELSFSFVANWLLLHIHSRKNRFIRGWERKKNGGVRFLLVWSLKSEVCLNKHAKYYVLNSSFLIRTCMYYIRTYVHRSIDRSFSCVTDVWLSVCLSAWNNEKIYLTIDGYAAAKLTGNKQLINIQTTFRLYI